MRTLIINKTSLLTFLIFFLINTSCIPKGKNIQNDESLSIELIQNKWVNDSTFLLNYKMVNNSNSKIYVPVINEFVQKVRDLDKEKFNDNFYVHLFDSKGQFIKANFLFRDNFGDNDTLSNYLKLQDSLVFKEKIKPYTLIKTGLLENLRYSLYKKNSRVLESKATLKNSALLQINENPYNYNLGGDIYFFKKTDVKNSTLQLIFKIDSNQIKKRLLPQDIDSLHKNKIKIFHGTIYSNKVPLRFEG